MAGDEFDEADLAVTNDGPPDGICLSNGMQSEHFPGRGCAPTRWELRAPGKAPSTLRATSGPQTPSAVTINGHVQPVKTETTSQGMTIQKLQQLPPLEPQIDPPASRPQGLPAPQAPLPQNKPAEAAAARRTIPSTSTIAPDGTPPAQDSSSTAEHNPPVGFFTARAAENLQKGSALPSNAPVFNPHLESPSIRKTAGVDHTKTKPVKTESIGAVAAAVQPRNNFVNPQTEKTRRVGMPMGAASPLQNRGSYKPPQMKRPADALVAQ